MRGRRRREYEEALARMRGWARAAAGPDWTGDQWSEILRRAIRQSQAPLPPRRASFWRPALAAATMLAALAAGAWYVTLGPESPAAAVPDSRAGEMLPADPADLVAPGRASATPLKAEANPLLPRPPESPSAWLYPGAGPGATLFLFLPPAVNR